MVSSTAQLNVRMDPSLKAAGDSLLARAGYTPAGFVRTVWERLALHPESSEKIIDAVAGVPRTRSSVADSRIMADPQARFAEICTSFGIDSPPAQSLTDEELDQAVIDYRYERERERSMM